MRRKLYTSKKQRGIALLFALMAASLSTITAVNMQSEHVIFHRRTDNILLSEQLYLYLLGAEDWARHVLLRDRKDNKVDSDTDDWGQELIVPVEDERGNTGTIGGKIDDLQGRFNINNLVDVNDKSADYKRFKRLLEILEIPAGLANAVMDWVDKDQDTRFPDGAEDIDYLDADPTYRTADRMIPSTTELLRVKGMTYEYYEKLEPFIVALPGRTDINVNTASPEILQAIFEDLSASDIETVIDDRKNAPFDSVEEMIQSKVFQKKKVDTTGLTVSSNYFLMSARAQFYHNDEPRARAGLQSMLYRKDEKSVKVLVRSQGGI